MKTRFVLFFAFFFFSIASFSQGYKKYTVVKGETVRDVAKKHRVTPYDIHRLNPDSKNGITENTILLIPTSASSKTTIQKGKSTKVVNTIHKLEPSETFYSLSKKYNVEVIDIENANPNISIDSLQIGQEIVIPINRNNLVSQVKETESVDAYVYHVVVKGETKYSIAKQFDMTLQSLEELNPEVKEVLPLGYKLKLYNKDYVAPQLVSIEESPYMMYVVRAKETFYNLKKKTGLNKEEIIKLNPEVKEGLKQGMLLKLPKATIINESLVTEEKELVDFTKSLIRTAPKEIALLIPFNLARIESDSVRKKLLRNDRFLNMTLDFYSGALMAIDSAQVLGLPLRVKILDSKETRNTSSIASIRDSLYTTDAVIGPFFPNNVETVASVLDTIPVISPLSKGYAKQYDNLFQSVPSSEYTRKALLDYLISKNGNILAITDVKKASVRQYLKERYPSIKIISLTEDGTIDKELLKNMMLKDVTNYVLLDTERVGIAINATKILAEQQEEYPIQLAVMDNNKIFENSEIPIARLTALKMIYPSVTNDNDENPRRLSFIKSFKEKNGYMPNRFAVRGFDVTFDIIMRLFQPQPFKEVMDTFASEQVKNKFSYTFENGGYHNKGIYIMHFDEELTVKEVIHQNDEVVTPETEESELNGEEFLLMQE
ncbi:LysM peptidoglycan-binding domain-containing protein [uncultured Flavobacterium sp.]|uniref:LysM peptidoglycan-binding domain-containing protein n=1 Tax=uncultured Flavobacterium sp. TaxID=165435 RepID=UPI0025E35D33|nr:LysM peptidoglycan-binding domain-containing protein [uncultured Flavobacterium sp.]